MDKKFIFTSDKESADILRKAGYIVVNESDNGWTFINDKNKYYQEIKNITFTNKIFV